MATYYAIASGNWNNPGGTVWSLASGGAAVAAGVYPLKGDRAVVETGYDVTVTANAEVGDNPGAGTAVLTLSYHANTSSLTINPGCSLTVYGDLKQDGNITITSDDVSGVAALYFDPEATAVRPTWTYSLTAPRTSRLTMRGTVTNRSLVKSLNTPYAQISVGTGVQITDCDYATFLQMYTMTIQPNGASGSVDLNYVTFDTCNVYTVTSITTNASFIWNRVTVKTSQHATNSIDLQGSAVKGTGARSMTDCVFDKIPRIQLPDFTLLRIICLGNINSFSSGVSSGSLTDSIIFISDGSVAPGVWGLRTIDQAYWVLDMGAYSNFHGPEVEPPSTAYPVRVTRNIFDGSQTTASGGHNLLSSNNTPSSEAALTIDHCIIAKWGGGSPGALHTLLSASANHNVSLEHNTVILKGDASDALGLTETSSAAGQYASIKSNLVHNTAAGAGGWKFDALSVTVDCVLAADITHNAGFQCATGSVVLNGVPTPATGYDGLSFALATPPGANDVDGVNAGFVNIDANITTWKGTTVAAVKAALAKWNDTDFDSTYDFTATGTGLFDYIRSQIRPTNILLKAAHDNVSPSNGWIGAVEGVSEDQTQLLMTNAFTGMDVASYTGRIVRY